MAYTRWTLASEHYLDIKCCTRSRPGVVLRQGYKYKPLMSVIGIEHLHNKNQPRAKHRVL
jgi:hypothetical protein